MFWGNRVNITESNMIEIHQHRMMEIVVCMSDTGKHSIDGEVFSFECGRTFFLPELVPHKVIGSEKEPAKIAFICFDMRNDIEHFTPAIRHIIRDSHENRHFASLDNEANERNLTLIAEIFQEMNSHSPLNQAMIGALLSQLIINHSRNLVSVVEPKPCDHSANLAKLRAWIIDNYRFELSIDEAAKRTGMSRSLFTRNFRKHNGMSLVEFIVSVRISNAIRLLASTDKPINDIAFECGFKNLGYFYRMFQRHTNSTPRKLRAFIIKTGNVPLV